MKVRECHPDALKSFAGALRRSAETVEVRHVDETVAMLLGAQALDELAERAQEARPPDA